MDSILRKLRGTLGVGLTWGVGWAIVTFLIGTTIGIVDPDSIDSGEEPWRMALIVGTVGFISGSAFALTLSSAERRAKSIRDLSVLRSAFWGALGGAALPLLTTMNDTILATTMPLGAIFAASTVAIARRAALREAQMVDELARGNDPGRIRA